MMRLQTYAGLSLIATLAVTYHAFSSRGQFYPAMVYLATSKISLVLLLNMGLVIMCVLWQLTKKVFLGSLREAEVERLNEQSWREVMEILFAITIFRQDFSVTFLVMVTALLLIKALHWLAQKRVEYIETTPSVPMLSHIRIVSFMGFLLLLDGLFLYSSAKHLILSRQASVSLFFSFEYMILATTTVSIFVKYIFYVSDMLMEGQWERKPVFTFYLELVRDLLHLSMYLCFFLVIFINYGVPLHLIRELYETFRNFKVRVADYIRYRKITSNMNDRFPDATPEELNASDATCIICREEMTTAKKLICGHLFHVHCLRSWLERQHTCPTCRALVAPPENGTTVTGGQQGSQSDAHRHGTGSGSTAQAEVGTGVAADNLSRHQARLQAAAAAASIYEKSYVYPSTTSLVCSPGYTPHPPVERSLAGSSSTELNGDQTSNEQAQKQFVIPGGPMNVSFPPMGNFYFLPSQTNAPHMNYGEGSGNDPNMPNSQLETQRKLQIEFLQNQLQLLQNQLQLLQKTNVDKSVDEGTSSSSSDSRGKHIAASSSVSNHGSHEEIQDSKP
ncbi:ERAD-associated E3 ubiquitin-protein ligase HRD1B-like isoform X1 [Gastrolobium bilobum]|uniref:ERAD-associated E3 ubiquitin-protein ligase HRD1B-like isoform X1 n=1 Tax=Gastrolobium bilobum TaxID=150636 RepID=UPI002AB2F60E|nr:ERAD-associated E3 ubiquitin-protein ligase HRD1B-like isoform X1 [Gastrolobium bilobum]